MTGRPVTPAGVCDDTRCVCGGCRVVDYERLARQRAAERRRLLGGPGRPGVFEGCTVDPEARPAVGGSVTSAGVVEY